MDNPLRWLGPALFVAIASSPSPRAIPATTAATAPQAAFSTIMKSWPGTWSCTKSVTGAKPAQWRETATAFGDKWIKFAGVYPAEKTEPQTAFETVLGYDSERHQWVTVTFLANGSYGIDRGSSGENAMMQTWANAYPVTSRITVTQVMRQRSFTVDGAWKEQGKHIRYHWSCTKL